MAVKDWIQLKKNYAAHKQEYLALKWAVIEKFSDYHYGHKFYGELKVGLTNMWW